MNLQLFNIPAVWLGIGLLGQALFSLRFVVQWIASERQRRSVIPAVFWQFSLTGGITLLVYAIHRRDPVFILGQLTGIVVYLRNLHFVRREGRPPTAVAPTPPRLGYWQRLNVSGPRRSTDSQLRSIADSPVASAATGTTAGAGTPARAEGTASPTCRPMAADLAGSVATMPVLLALSTRADGDPITAAWRARARGCPVTTLDLAPLADDEARELAMRFGDIPGKVRERCLDTAAGNPLFLVQLLRSARSGQDALPGSVRALLLARVERLAHDAQRALHAAAVLGPRFSLDALRHVAAAPDWEPVDLEALGLATSLRVVDRYDEALEVLRQAEDDATAEGDPRRLARVWHQRGNMHFPRGELEQCLCAHQRSLELAEGAGSPEDVARAHGGLCDAEYQRGRMQSALRHVLRCLELAVQHRLGTLRLAYLPMAAACRKYCGEFPAAQELAQQAATAAQEAGDLRTELVARSVAAMLALYRTDFAAALEGGSRSAALARQIGARRFEIEARVLAGLAHHGLGTDGEALAILTEAADQARAEAATYCAPWALAALALVRGSPAEGRRLLDEGRDLLQRGSVSPNHFELHAIGIEFSLRCGDTDGALRHAADLATYTRDEPLPWVDLVVGRGRALVAAARNPGHGATVEVLRQTLQRARAMGFAALAPRLEAALGPGG